MKIVLPTFDQFRRYLKRNDDVSKEPTMVDTASFLSTKLPFKVPFIIDDRMGWDASEQAIILQAECNVMTVLHEAWHYFMSPRAMLKYNNYGLSIPVGGEGIQEEYKRDGDDEEEAVCYLTIATARKLRLPVTAIMEEADYANLIEPFVQNRTNARKEYDTILSLIKKRDLSRFGFDMVYSSPSKA